MSVITSKFILNSEDIEFFRSHGFLKLKNFFTADVIDHMKTISLSSVEIPQGNYGSGFSKLKYDIGNDDPIILNIIKDKKFTHTINQLAGKEVFFTQGLGFELEKNKSTGFPWHVGTQSFGFQRVEDYGFTIWTPLCPINVQAQRGGMAYVSKALLSGEFIYQHINLLPQYMKAKQEAGDEFRFQDFSAVKNNLLNSKEMSDLLNFHAVEDDFELGDTFIFDKYVLHRSVKLEDGPIDTRLAYALRFSGTDACYDKERVKALDYPRRLFNYDVSSEFNEDVCSIDNENIFESAYFDATREQRKLCFNK